ncbi:Prephenate dehydratase [Candidatus Sulfotelmatobacter kueseliae]|uniref:Prephenate dehydratase n=1 Tax=Candidatus Sulfotelmatobacter kueseliae TaxID=2042962 RepID=A0A2U3KAU1_9BACT|nr:Prephenate dehydratase [Candidatus Sulfotelmatobacter kueseliae]
MKVAIQGELGSFSHEAAERMLPRCTVVPCARSAEVFDRVERGSVAAAVIPIENTLAGTVAEHADLLVARDVFIQGEYLLRIVHNLIAAPGAKLKSLRRVLSHPVALDQCRDFFRHHRHLEAVPFYDTAGSVKHVIAERLKDAAGIAGRQAAHEYAGKILQAGIEDDKRNFTRFFLIRKREARKNPHFSQNRGEVGHPIVDDRYRRLIPRGANKTSIAFQVKNLPGALFKSLSVFALRDISLSKIESRPMRGRPWEYVFYVDFLRGDDEPARNALRHLGEVAEFVKVLGIYRAA